ncbi:MAG: CoA-binding protein [Syntrophales bacterium]|jgi:acetyltransferase|nr:CoA-binding protein [Syntrophales bacterium]MCK9528358.1 CoA-binding protein [Syntrophales bacterium]MDX9922717.1 CoA-binding protein [Syntrophales bacterium]
MGALPREFFNPRSVAVIGATRKPGFGSGIPRLLKRLGYTDHLYLVNPREHEIEGLPVYRRVTDIPDPVDLAIVIVPRDHARSVIEDCIAKNIHAVILETAGFSETGPEGARMEREIADLIKDEPVRIIGPNCVGLINPHGRFTSTEVALEDITPGNIGVIAQSGVFGSIVADWAPGQDLAVSSLVTIGNRLDVDEADVLYHFAQDATTDVIVLYLEGAKDGRRFRKALGEASRRKPVLLYKSGRTEVGRRAAASHTGSMSGVDGLYEGLLKQAGVIRASSFQELFDLARVFSRQPLMKGTDTGIVSTSGSLGVMAADAAVQWGLRFPDLSPGTLEMIERQAPAWMNVKNPLDVGPSGLFGPGLEGLLRDSRIQGVIAIPVVPDSTMRLIADRGMGPDVLTGDVEALRRLLPDKPVVTYTVGGAFWTSLARKTIGPHFTMVRSAETAAKALWALHRYYRFRRDNP